MRTFPLALKPAPSAVHEPAGWFIAGADPAAWLDEIARWGLPTESLQLYVLPTSIGDRTPAGVLVVAPDGALRSNPTAVPVAPILPPPVRRGRVGEGVKQTDFTYQTPSPALPRSTGGGSEPAHAKHRVLRAQPYGRLAGRLFLPADAVLHPPVSEAELREALLLDVLVLHPAAGLVGFKKEEALAVHELLAAPPRREADWGRAVAAEGSRWRLVSVEPEDVPRIEQIIEQGRGDIGTQSPESLPRSADESKLSDLKDAFARAGRPGLKLLRWLTSLAPRTALSPTWVNRLEQWASRKLSQAGSGLESARLRELERLRKMLERDPDEGLRHAIPLRDLPGRGLAPPGARLLPRDTNFNLSGILGGGGFADPWQVPHDYMQALTRQYREAANRELRLGRHRRAAYIFAHLLGDFASAANALEQGRHYREAAVLYRDHLKNALKAAECLEQGGLLVEAIPIYVGLRKFEKAGDLYTRIERPDDATRCYRLQVHADLNGRDFLKAAALLETKLGVPDEALEVLTNGAPGDASGACLRASFQLLARLARHEEAMSRIDRLRGASSSIPSGPVLAQVLADVATTYPELNVRTASADGTRVVAGVRLSDPDVNFGDRQALAGAVGRLAPEDRLLARDVERFLARPKVPPPLRAAPRQKTRAAGDPVVLRQFRLAGGVTWLTAAAAGLSEGQAGGEGFYALGGTAHGGVIARGRWDGFSQHSFCRPKRPWASDADWALHPVPGASRVTVMPPVEWVLPHQFPPISEFPARLEAGFPELLTAGLLGMCHADNGVTWALHSVNEGEVVLSCYKTGDGALIASHAHHNLPPPPEERITMVARNDRVYVAWGAALLRFGPAERVHVEAMPQPLKRLVGAWQYADHQLAASMQEGGVLLRDVGRNDAFGEGMEDPRITFTRSGLLVVADARSGRVYHTGAWGAPRQSPVRRGEFAGLGPGLIALTPTQRLDEFAAFTDDGKVTVYQVPQ
jgi:hypothetical protein